MSGSPGLSGSARPVTAAQKSAEGIVAGSPAKARTTDRVSRTATLMRTRRQNIQLELALEPVAKGEARSPDTQGTEARTAHAEPERPAAGQQPLMEAVVEPGNLKKALARVRRNRGAPGVDGMTVDELGDHLKVHWPEIRSRLLAGSYTPQPVRWVEIPKASGGVRRLGVPTVLDRFIQQAVMQVLQEEWDPGFSDASYGFRPGRSAHQAVRRAQEHILAGFDIVVDLTATYESGVVTLSWSPPTTGGAPTSYQIWRQKGSGAWRVYVTDTWGTSGTTYTDSDITAGETYRYQVKALNASGASAESNSAEVTLPPPVLPPPPPGPRQTVPDAPRNLLADGTDGAMTLTWDAPASDGGSAITDYEYRINGRNSWISIGSTLTTHTVSGLVNGTAYAFEVRAVNRIGKGRASNRAEATPEPPEAFTLDFAHSANGTGITSDFVLVNVEPHPIRPAIYFYDTEGNPIAAESVLDVTGDMAITEDGSLTVQMEMEPLGELTISTHGQGELVSGSVKVVSDGLIAGFVRYSVPGVGVAGVGASPPISDAFFPARRQEGGIRTAAALHNLGAEAVGVSCRLMSGGVALEEVEIPLAANGQASWFIEDAFTAIDTSDFAGSVRYAAPGRGWFTAIAVEMDAAKRIFTALPVALVDRGGGGRETTLDFAHFANGTGITSDLVFVNMKTEVSGPAPTPFHVAIPPIRPAIYFYDTRGNPIAAELVVEVTGDLEIAEDGALTVRTQMEPLGALTISTHGRGELVSRSVRVVAEGPIGGMLRFDLPHIGEAVVGASPPLGDALFPVRRQEGGITTGVALHNLESSPGLLRCDLMREGVLLDAASIALEANGQTSWLIDAAFPSADTSDFVGLVRCDAVGEGRFTAVALEMDPGTRTFITLPVVPVAERMSQE